jgi:transcriptional regulator with XRE-family HTH domain
MVRGRGMHAGTMFTRQLKAWMALADLDDTALAQAVGVSAASVGRWKNGINTPAIDRWPALATTLNVEEAEIAKLLVGVELLPPDVQAVGQLLAKLPLSHRQRVVQQIDRLIEEEERRLQGGYTVVAQLGAAS